VLFGYHFRLDDYPCTDNDDLEATHQDLEKVPSVGNFRSWVLVSFFNALLGRFEGLTQIYRSTAAASVRTYIMWNDAYGKST
jgi:hypothetical protein